MNAKAEQAQGSSAADAAKLMLALLLAAGGIFCFYWFDNAPQVVRVLGLIAAIVVAGAIAAFTALGRRARHYIAETQFEMRKVVWPTREETIKTTVVILIVVVILSLLLGAIDLLLKAVILDWLLKLGN
jgi:preprotein translocase subunit SecE